MTPNANTTISAIGVLRADIDGMPLLDVYHNRHARNPIEPEWLRQPSVHHFRLPNGATSRLAGWEKA